MWNCCALTTSKNTILAKNNRKTSENTTVIRYGTFPRLPLICTGTVVCTGIFSILNMVHCLHEVHWNIWKNRKSVPYLVIVDNLLLDHLPRQTLRQRHYGLHLIQRKYNSKETPKNQFPTKRICGCLNPLPAGNMGTLPITSLTAPLHRRELPL